MGTDVGSGDGCGVLVGSDVTVGFEVGTWVGRSVGAAVPVTAALPATAIQRAGSTQRSTNDFIALGFVSDKKVLLFRKDCAPVSELLLVVSQALYCFKGFRLLPRS